MALRSITTYPDTLLREMSKPVTAFDTELETLLNDMIDTMYAEAGVGLAAVQIGVLLRVCTMDTSRPDEAKAPRVFINPDIMESQGSAYLEEGCLSVPGFKSEFARPDRVLVNYLD